MSGSSLGGLFYVIGNALNLVRRKIALPLFISERHHWVDMGGSTGWDVAGQDGYRD